MKDEIKYEKDEISEELEEVVEEARELAESFGLEPRDVNYWIVDQDEMNQLAAYGGFQERYPHWRWGMQYDRQRKESEHLGGKAFEMVNNDTPCHAFLQMSNSLADQKAVITHVEAHSDFFANNEWFQDKPDASDMLSRHAENIEGYINDTDIDRDEVERWIDHILCLEDTIDQYSQFRTSETDEEEDEEVIGIELDIDEQIEEVVFSDEEEESVVPKSIGEEYADNTENDLLEFLIEEGNQYDSLTDSAEEYEEWQLDILRMLREEAYYFAPQKMTKVMNEGWAALYESMMMADEEFATGEDIIDYADHQSMVLGSPGFNPYKLGIELWKHIENTVNRREVIDKLLRVEGISSENFHSSVDFQGVHETLDERDGDDIEKRHYSLTRPENQGFISDVSISDLKEMERYIIKTDRFETVQEALSEVDYGAGWSRMREIRETHNDVMFIDEFLTQDFVDDQQYFTYEYRASKGQMQVASKDVEDVKKKMLLKFTNFGKPTIEVGTGNFLNSGELLLLHKYNGVMLNLDEAQEVLTRLFELWGRPVNLATVQKQVTEEEMDYAYSEGVEPEAEENFIRLRFDGSEVTTHEVYEDVAEYIKADEIDYNTKPEEWL